MALGLKYAPMTALVILPQALTLVLPGIVNNFIGLFMDTTLISDCWRDRLPRSHEQCDQGSSLGGANDHGDGLCLRRHLLFHFLLWNGAILGSHRESSRQRAHVMSSALADNDRGDDAAIRFSGVHKWYGSFHVLRNISLTVARGERIVVCGPSGSGKSTLIRCVNRLEEHQRGSIVVDGVELTDDIKRIDEVRREVGMVFQNFNLFPHLTILENCTLAPIWVRKMPRREAEELAIKLLERVRIAGSGAQISGSAFGRSAAARCDRARLVHDPEDHAVRRADVVT